MHRVSAIIASTGQLSRADSLMRAVRSLEDQKEIDLTIIIVLNGPNVDSSLRKALGKRPNLVLDYQSEPSLPRALHYGRTLVKTDYFCFLDDDDSYIPHTLHLRCRILAENPSIDVVASNGYVNHGNFRSLLMPPSLSLAENPLEELFRRNWLASCGGLYRSSTIDKRYFKKNVKFYEWTMTAFLIALDRKVAFLKEPTFTINHTEDSLSSSEDYVYAKPDFLKSLLRYPVPREIKKIISQRRADSLHEISVMYLDKKDFKKAWQYHLRSFQGPHRPKYLLYTRHLFGWARS